MFPKWEEREPQNRMKGHTYLCGAKFRISKVSSEVALEIATYVCPSTKIFCKSTRKRSIVCP